MPKSDLYQLLISFDGKVWIKDWSKNIKDIKYALIDMYILIQICIFWYIYVYKWLTGSDGFLQCCRGRVGRPVAGGKSGSQHPMGPLFSHWFFIVRTFKIFLLISESQLWLWSETHWFRPWSEQLWNEDLLSSSWKKLLLFGNPVGCALLVGGYCLGLSEKNIQRKESQIWMSAIMIFKSPFLDCEKLENIKVLGISFCCKKI